MKAQLTPSTGYHRTNLRYSLRIATFVVLVALIGIPLFSSSSASSVLKRLGVGTPSIPTSKGIASRSLPRKESRTTNQLFKKNLPVSSFPLLLPQGGETITTFEYPGCTVPKSSFDLGETVCAVIAGAPLGDPDRAARRLAWVSPYGSVTQGAEIVSDPQTGTYAIPATATQTFTDDGGGTVTVDNRGKWRIYISSAADNSLRSEVSFTVHDPAKAFVDLHVEQSLTTEQSQVTAGSSSVFEIYVNNFGPNAAENVVITDTVPANTESQSITDHGAGFSCDAITGGVITCTLANLAADTTAHLTLNYSVSTGTSAGTTLTNLVSVSSSATPCPGETTCEIQPSDNSSTATATVPTGGGGGTCTLDCPDNVNAVANTTEDSQRGAHVTFSAAEPSGTCGTITATPASGSFFPVGTTTVTVVSDTGGGSCSFIVTVEDTGSDPPTISCPGNHETNADASCSASVSVGTASATGNNVTVFATRSDGKPMYNCDANGTNCTRRASDDPFPAGVTTITWIAHTHSVAGPYADADAEEATRTGAASCTQTITVNDVTPPTIVPPANQAASVDATCQYTLPDYTAMATVSDNCACASSDTSEICDTREPITITQSPAPGTVVGRGPTTITLTANDGSSNNGGAGNTATAQFTVTVSDTTAPTITVSGANPQYVECHTSYTELGATANDNCDGSFAATASGTVNVNVVGTYTITYNASDAAGNAATPVTRTVIVQDTIAPTITLNSYAPSMWPPNHKYTTFQLTQFVTGASDSCDTGLDLNDVVIEKVTSDEIENGNGDGNTTNDIVIAANCKSVQLRSEREGSGNGRVYTITFKVSDGFNTTRVTAKVVVPHNPGETPVDSGVHYTVNSSCP